MAFTNLLFRYPKEVSQLAQNPTEERYKRMYDGDGIRALDPARRYLVSTLIRRRLSLHSPLCMVWSETSAKGSVIFASLAIILTTSAVQVPEH